MRGFSFQKVPNCDWHGPRSHINRVGPIKTTDQVPAEIVQIGIEDGGYLRPLFVVAKNLAVANYSDNLARLSRQYSLGACFSVLCVRCDVYNPEFGALFRFPCYCPRTPRDGALTLSDVLSPLSVSTIASADENGALAGAAGGAVTGAVVGGPIGAAVGGVAGAVVGGAATVFARPVVVEPAQPCATRTTTMTNNNTGSSRTTQTTDCSD